jgi:hypothetical protein
MPLGVAEGLTVLGFVVVAALAAKAGLMRSISSAADYSRMIPTVCGTGRRHAGGNPQSHPESTVALRAELRHHFPRPHELRREIDTRHGGEIVVEQMCRTFH